VADRLAEIFKADRLQFEEKWDNLKIFIQYGMLSDEKFYERGEKFALLKTVESKYFTFEEYKTLVGENQKDKNGDVIYLYTNNIDEQYSYIEHAKEKGYDVLLMDGQLDVHVVGQLEQKFEKTRFVRVDSDVIDKIIQKDDVAKVTFSDDQRDALVTVFDSQLPVIEKTNFIITFEQLAPSTNPVFVTKNEFMRRMKEMSALQGGGGMMNFYGEMPDSYNLVVNTAHPLVEKLLKDEEEACGLGIAPISVELAEVKAKHDKLKDSHKGKKDEEIPTAEKSEMEDLQKTIDQLTDNKKAILKSFAADNKQVRQLIDLALLASNMLKGEALAKFVKRSVELL
jgi:molecular chaperone HtpG